MYSISIENKNDLYFEKAWQIYLESFPEQERRTINEQEKILKNKNFNMNCYIKNDLLIAIVFFWDINIRDKNYTFLEHFAVNSKLRGKSYGSKILNEFIENNKNIILEIEPIIDEITQKRLKFYEKFGFVINKHEHFQVPFRKNAKELKLILMSQNSELSNKEYENLYKQMKEILQ